MAQVGPDLSRHVHPLSLQLLGALLGRRAVGVEQEQLYLGTLCQRVPDRPQGFLPVALLQQDRPGVEDPDPPGGVVQPADETLLVEAQVLGHPRLARLLEERVEDDVRDRDEEDARSQVEQEVAEESGAAPRCRENADGGQQYRPADPDGSPALPKETSHHAPFAREATIVAASSSRR
ncbi:hypothetical protein [Plantactinospora sp. GCM10030261]|uniref:hypothetical protein n=1 Tax=Plantactinospora sp. GCM10030261 TaxID=3273420 RepID=UPI00361A8F8B